MTLDSSVKADPAGKRRVKSARRAGKSVSFIDEKSEPGAELDTPVMDLVPKEDPLPEPVATLSYFQVLGPVIVIVSIWSQVSGVYP